MNEDLLIDRLQKIEALFARTTHAGEKAAAATARERILERLRLLEQVETPVEYRFSLPDPWARSLFLALVRRYNIHPYRYPGQRRSSVMIRVAPSFLEETLAPEFQQLQETLSRHLHEVTERIIAQAIHADQQDAEECAEDAPGARELPQAWASS